MTLGEFLKTHRLDNSLLFGFYGGGNYGDELLMEVLAGLLKQQGATHVDIAYQHPENYDTFHHDFEYPLVNMHSKPALLKALLRKKQIVVGGGGLWGMDANLNVLMMSILLFLGRFVMGKKVYLLAIGYYNSSTTLGRIGAWFAGKAANHIIARDDETYANFSRINKHTSQDTDIAWHIDELNLKAYQADVDALDRQLHVESKTLFITLRRFKDTYKNHLAEVIADCLEQNGGRQVIIALMEPREVDPEGYALLKQWRAQFNNVQVLDFSFNPLALFLFFRRHHENLVFIGPQFHAILSAHLTGVPYLPLVYDNKVERLLHNIAPDTAHIPVQGLQAADVQNFIDTTYRITA
jgi:polysaccharide pyruvyl transferase WcaK-like protein